MCLFDIEHCQADNLWHLVNIAVILFILASAVLTTMLLLKFYRDRTKVYSDDETCMITVLQVAALCVATLPFTTGLLCVGREQLGWFPIIWYLVAGVPCAVGWFTVVWLFCYPFALFEEAAMNEDLAIRERRALTRGTLRSRP